MKHISNIDYIKSEYKKINSLFLQQKFNLVIEKSKKIIKKNPNQIPFYNLLALSYRETNRIIDAEKTLISSVGLDEMSEDKYSTATETKIKDMYVIPLSPMKIFAGGKLKYQMQGLCMPVNETILFKSSWEEEEEHDHDHD